MRSNSQLVYLQHDIKTATPRPIHVTHPITRSNYRYIITNRYTFPARLHLHHPLHTPLIPSSSSVISQHLFQDTAYASHRPFHISNVIIRHKTLRFTRYTSRVTSEYKTLHSIRHSLIHPITQYISQHVTKVTRYTSTLPEKVDPE